MPFYVNILSGMIERDQSALLRPISVFFGWIMNFFFEIAHFFSVNNSLGIAIIFVTLVIRVLMLPLSIKTQKSTAKMAELQPEIKKIQAKYEGKTDRESKAKMTQEIQALYAKNNASMFGGCLPLFIQMPIFFALNFIMRQSFLFINKLGEIYKDIANNLYLMQNPFKVLKPIAEPRIPSSMFDEAGVFNLAEPDNLMKVINKMSDADWQSIFTSPEFLSSSANVQETLVELVERKDSIEMFIGIDLLSNAGTAFPGVLIPILSAVFMFLSSHLMNRRQKNADAQTKTMQRVMTIFFPLLIGWTTINFPAGVGLYWTISNVFQVGQQIVLDKFFRTEKKNAEKSAVKDDKVVKVIPPDKQKKK